MKWVIAYDVTCDTRRRRLAAELERVGFRRQKSVFEGELRPAAMKRLLAQLATLLEPEHDCLTAWPTTPSTTAPLLHFGVPRTVTQSPWRLI